MMDIEHLLRSTLRSRLGDMESGGGLPSHVVRRAKRGRVMVVAATAITSVLVVSGATLGTASLLRQSPEQPPSGGIDIGPLPISERDNGVIAYTPAQSTGELRLIRPDGSKGVIRIPEGIAWDHAWSPDGTQLAVAISPLGTEEKRGIWVMDADGADARQVAAAETLSGPSWAPDGTWIAYSARTDSTTSIHAVRPDGSEDRVLHTEGAEGTFSIFSVHFSPDGTQLLFDRGTDSGFDIFMMKTDGSDVQRLTTTGIDYDPYWSPDGSQIVFTREDDSSADENTTPTSDIFVMDADGGNVQRLTEAQPQDTFLGAVWSPDGTKIAYTAGRTGGGGPMVVMAADGSNRKMVVTDDVLGISWQSILKEDTSRPDTGMASHRVWDEDVAFELTRMDCSLGKVGDEDSDLTPDGKFCMVGIAVFNASSERIVLPLGSHVLETNGARFRPWEEGMDELAADDPGSLYADGVPPGGGGQASIYFELPDGAQPKSLEVHASESSEGAVIRLTDCSWNEYQGEVSGGCYRRSEPAQIGVPYPHSISTYSGNGPGLLQVTCFDRVEWEVTSHPVDEVPEGFTGQGTITLITLDAARFDDNSGVVLNLAPTARNTPNDRLCG